jgi:hypothetical protein
MLRVVLLAIGLLVSIAGPIAADPLADIRAGNRAFGEGRLEQALADFSRAIDSGALDLESLALAHNNRGVVFGEPGYSTTGFQGHNQATLYREQPWGTLKPLWVISSAGPDQDHEPMDPETATLGVQDYDPTNGSVSDGDIMRARGE